MSQARYGAGVWFIHFGKASSDADNTKEDPRSTWGNTIGWNIQPGAVVRKGVQGLIYAGDIARGFDVYACGSAEQKCDPVVTRTKFGPPSAAQGSGVNYELAYHNAGPAASTNAKIVDRLPAELRFVSASDGGSYDFSTRTVTWRPGYVDVGETGEVSLNARVPSTVPVGTAMINKADFTGDLTISPPTAVTVTWVTPGSTTAAALGGTSLIPILDVFSPAAVG